MKSRIPLKGYLSLHLGVVAVLPVITIFILVWVFMMPAVKTRTTIQHHAVARAVAGQISAYLKGGVGQLTALAEYLQKRALDSGQEVVDLLDAQCGAGSLFEALFIVDTKDTVVKTVGLAQSRRTSRADYIGLDFSARCFATVGKSVKKAVWSPIFLSTISSRMAVALTVPLGDRFIVGEITLENLSEFISLLSLKSEFLTLVIDGQGLIVADSQRLRSGQVLNADYPAVKKPAAGTSLASAAFELDGVEMLGTVVEMDAVGWKVIFAQPVKKAFQPLRDTLTLIGFGLAIALGLSLAIAWLLAGNLTVLFASYAQKAEAIAGGRYDLQWPVAKTREFFQLSQNLQRMAEKINRREKALVDSEQRLRDLVTNVPGVVYQYKADPKALASSSLTSVVRERSIDIFGLDAEQENFFNDFVACLPEEDRSRFVLSVKDALEAASPWYYEGRFTKPTGEEVWLEGRSVPRWIGGELVYYGLFSDITWRKEMESSLRLSQFIIDRANIGIYRIDPDGRIKEVNQKAAELLGYTKQELESLSIADVDPLVASETWGLHWQRLVAQGTRTVERQHRKKDNTMIPVDIYSNVLEYEGQQYAIAFIQDISERKKNEDALREKDQLLHDMGRLVKIGAWKIDAETGKSTYTDEVARIYDLEPDQYVSVEKSIGCYHGVHREKIEHALNEAVEQGTPYDLELEMVSFKGIRKWVRTTCHPVMRDGRVIQVEGSFQDISEGKRMEHALKESEQRLDLALSGANEGIWDLRVPENTLYLDTRYYTMAGYPPNAFPSTVDEVMKRIHKDDVEQVKLINEQNIAGNLEVFEVEFRFLRQDGNYMWIHTKGRVVARDETGKPNRFSGTNADITERKQAEEKLREHEQLLSNILESMNEGLVVLDRDLKCTIFNRSLSKMIDRPKEEVLGQVPWEVLPYLKDSPVEKNVKKTMAGESAETLEIQHQLPNGKPLWSRDSFSPLKDAQGCVVGVVGVITDVTRQKQDEESLRRLRNYLSNIIDSMPSILVAVDGEGKVTQWNHQTEQATGLSFDKARYQPLAKVFPRLAGEMERISAAIRERRVISSPKVSRKVDNQTRFEDITIFPLAGNGVEGAVIRVDDVTGQVRLEEMMIQNEKMLSVGGLAAGMAHEINNPLAGILQNASVLKNRLLGDLPANQKAAEAAGTTLSAIQHYLALRKLPGMIESIRTSGSLAAAIVRNMLSFSRKSEQIVTPHDLGTLLDQSIDLLKTDYDMKKHYDFKRIEIVRQYDAAAGPVPSEPSKIQQVFMNILKNGAEAMADAADAADAPSFTLRVKDDGAWVRVEIEDSGPGMDESISRRIFEPFFTTKPVGKGTGLGLSVSYFIVTEDHGGEMSVHAAAKGGGTCFVIRLPKTSERQ